MRDSMIVFIGLFVAVITVQPAAALSQEVLRSESTPSLWNQDRVALELPSQARAAHTPDVLRRPAKLNVENVRVGRALNVLRKNAGVALIFSPDFVPDIEVVCECHDVTVEDALNHLLDGTDLQFVTSGDQVIISRRIESVLDGGRVVPASSGLFQLGPSRVGTVGRFTTPGVDRAARQGTITGRVLDAGSMQPLPGTQVVMTELERAVLAQTDGTYSFFDVPSGVYLVEASLIGYGTVTQEVTVVSGETSTLDFELVVQALVLDELVVTGTPGGTQRRAIGNAVERMDVADLSRLAPVRSVQDVLTARLPGVTTSGTNGMAGMDAAPIRIRGGSSLGVTNSPLVYIDGIRMNSDIRTLGRQTASSRINDVNPEDIESIEVIKGPAAATLYGTEASNGVIHIITKRGVSGSPTFDAGIDFGANWFPNPRTVIPTGYALDPATNELVSGHLWDTYQELTGDRMFQAGPIMNASLAARGGSDLIRYYASINHANQEGIVSWNTDKRTNGRLSLTLQATDQLGITVNGSFLNSNSRSGGANLWGSILRQNMSTLDNPQRRGFQVFIDAYGSGEEDRFLVDRSTWSLETNYTPANWLTARLVTGIDRTGEERSQLTYREPDAPSGFFGSSGFGSKQVTSWDTQLTSIDLATTVRFRLPNGIGSATSTGLQYNDKELSTKQVQGEEFAARSLTTVGAAARTTSNEDFLENRTLGFYVQQQFDLNERLFVTSAIRMDDNSAFGSEFEAAIYPKLSATWVLSEESFWNFDPLEVFRVRGAWGQAGQQPDVFAATRLYQTVASASGVSVLEPSSIGNPDLGPEKGEELELGFDAVLLDNRLDVQFTQYWKTTNDAIIPVPNAPSSGFPGTRLQNIGQVRNWGSEVAVSVGILRRDNLQWDMTLTGSTMFSRVEDIGGVERVATGNVPEAQAYHVEGLPLATLWGTRVVSAEFLSGNSGPIDEATAMCDGGQGPHTETLGGLMGGPAVPCTEAPLVYIGRPGEPTWAANVTSTLGLSRGVSLFATVDARGGHANMNQANCARLTAWGNTLAGLRQDDPVVMGTRTFDRRWLCLYKAGFARLREVGLNYLIPERFAGTIGASRASINLSARNLNYLWMEEEYHHLSGEHIISPEIREVGNEFSGHSHVQLPPTSQVTMEVRVTF